MDAVWGSLTLAPIIHWSVQNWVTSTCYNIGLRTLFLFLPWLLLFYSSILNKIHYYSSKPALLFSLSWWIILTGRFLANFGNITQIIENWKRWLRVHNIPVDQSFWEGNKGLCTRLYGQYCSCAALSNFATIHMQSKTFFLGPPKVNIIKMLLLFHPALFLFLYAYYYSQNYSSIMFAT